MRLGTILGDAQKELWDVARKNEQANRAERLAQKEKARQRAKSGKGFVRREIDA